MLDYRLNPGANEKVLQNKRSIRISGLQLNITASILDLLRKNWTYQNKRSTRISNPQLKIKNKVMAYR